MIRRTIATLREGRGSAAIEFALVSPIFVILLVGVVELGFAGLSAMRVQDAAEAGALYAQVHGWDQAGIVSAVTHATGASAIGATPVPVTFCGCPGAGGIAPIACTDRCGDGSTPGQYITVSASVPRIAIMPQSFGALPDSFTAHSTVRIQ